MESEPAGARGPFRRRIGVRALGIVPSALRRGRCAAGAAAGFEPSRRVISHGLDTSVFRSMAATQPVDGAALIRRYRSVRLRGGQLGRIPSAL